MSRHPQVRYRPARKTYYCQIDGTVVNLGKKQQEAHRRFNAMMAARAEFAEGEDPEVFKLIHKFLEQCAIECSPGTYGFYKLHLESFVKSLEPGLRVSQLKKHHVTKWMNRACPPSRAANTRRNAIRSVQRPFNWAVEEGIIPRSPIDKIKKPKATSRQVELTDAQFKKIIAAIKDEAFRDVMLLMRETGLRPEEARKISVREFDREGRLLKLAEGFTAKTKEDREVPLNDRAMEICVRWADRFNDGPFMRNTRGNVWRKQALVDRCARLRVKLGFHFTAYCVRHLFCVSALEAGVDPIKLARLMGHSDLQMIQRVYGQIQRRADAMRAAMEQATAPTFDLPVDGMGVQTQ